MPGRVVRLEYDAIPACGLIRGEMDKHRGRCCRGFPAGPVDGHAKTVVTEVVYLVHTRCDVEPVGRRIASGIDIACVGCGRLLQTPDHVLAIPYHEGGTIQD